MANIKLFENKQVRSVWVEAEGKWYFSVQDVVEILTDSSDVKQYLKRMLSRDLHLKLNWGTLCTLVEMEAADGKRRKIQAADAKGILRIIQSIPSSKAEPFKLWLAQVGSDRLEEIENPELASQRARELYKLKGYSNDWIEKRMRSIAIREELTDEWDKHGVKESREYAILTAEISKATFGLTPSEYKQVKGLKRENLRDHMNDLELIFSMLGEASTVEIVKENNPNGFVENKKAASRGGKIAGDARHALELETGAKVVSSGNYLTDAKPVKQIKKAAGKKLKGK
ncbi:MAG: phage antirepressor protein [Acidobacteria bacterium]|nr:phage antirepressor protein [Acidobacteriota bacterium]